MRYAPIILFAFNRLDTLKNAVCSLLQNEEAKESELFVFVDGARPQKKGECEKVEAVRHYVRHITGFKRVTYSFSDMNRGLGASVIKGVTEVMGRYGRAIVIEDDLVFARNFLFFMNKGLDVYEKDRRVFSVCGYTNRIDVPEEYAYDAYFCTRSSSWGWATWADRWNSVDWELNDWDGYAARGKEFNRWGGSDCRKMLFEWKKGKNQSWAIRFCFAQFLQDKLSLFPVSSKVKNDGFDGQGTNCKKWSRFRYEFDETGKKHFVLPEAAVVNRQLFRSAMRYHGLAIRIYSKLMYILTK